MLHRYAAVVPLGYSSIGPLFLATVGCGVLSRSSTEIEAAKTNCAALVSVLLLSIPVRGQVPHALDVRPIKAATAAWDQAWNAGNADALASLYTDGAIAMGPNHPALVGKEAIRASSRKYFDEVKEENRSLVEDVRVSGDLAVARGTQTTKTSPKAGGASVEDKAKWVVVFQRQRNGAWKILWEIYNSDLPPDCRRQ